MISHKSFEQEQAARSLQAGSSSGSRRIEEALDQKLSEEATYHLIQRYSKLTEAEREPINQAIASWVLSEDAAKRFDARVLIDEYTIQDAAAALERLSERLAKVPGPVARHERKAILKVLEKLS